MPPYAWRHCREAVNRPLPMRACAPVAEEQLRAAAQSKPRSLPSSASGAPEHTCMQARFARLSHCCRRGNPALQPTGSTRCAPHLFMHQSRCQGSTMHTLLSFTPRMLPQAAAAPGVAAQICMVCTSQLRSERPPLSSRKVRLCPTATITCSGCAIAQRRNCPTRSCRSRQLIRHMHKGLQHLPAVTTQHRSKCTRRCSWRVHVH